MPIALSQLPALDLVRGFVAVGRRMSITLAAQDLCLTQSAVSRQIQALEAQLGVKLLERGHRALRFTAEGERLFRSANAAVQQLQDVVGEVRTRGMPRPVTLTASVGLTGLWLLPRLGRFQQRHPGVDVRVAANGRLADLSSDDIDLAIRYTAAAQVPAGALRLFGESLAPVAHPALGLADVSSPQALKGQTLLEFDDPAHPWLQWRDWLHRQGWSSARRRGVLQFNQYDLVIQAALAGQGVALGRLELIQPLIDAGQLQRLDAPVPVVGSTHAYWLMQADAQPRQDVQLLADWIQAEARATGRSY